MKKWPLFIGKYAGIKVIIHWTFWIIIAWLFLVHFQLGYGWIQGLAGSVFILAIFGCVVLHEFGHALTAKHYGISTQDITLYPIGGVPSLEKMPVRPEQGLTVALAGPALNTAVAVVFYLITEDQPVTAIWDKVLHGDTKAVPVVSNGQVVGVLSNGHVSEQNKIIKRLKNKP